MLHAVRWSVFLLILLAVTLCYYLCIGLFLFNGRFINFNARLARFARRVASPRDEHNNDAIH